MATVDLPTGPIEYGDTGGDGPVLVLTHGLLQDATLWTQVLDALPPGIRTITPTLPLGAHPRAQAPDADLSVTGLATLLGSFLDALDLQRVTLVVNDTGFPLLLAAQRHPRVAQLVVTPCELYENLPPGLPGRAIALSVKIPGGVTLSVRSLRLPGGAKLPFSFGWMTKRGVPKDQMKRWTAPYLADKGVRADLVKYLRTAVSGPVADATAKLPDFPGPVLIVWASEDKVMPVADARRLAESLPKVRRIELPDTYTLIPLDQPLQLASLLGGFVLEQVD